MFVEFIHFMINVQERQLAADPWTKPTDLVCELYYTLLLSTPIIAIYREKVCDTHLPSHLEKNTEMTFVVIPVILAYRGIKCMLNNCLEWDKWVLNERPFPLQTVV